MSEENLVMFLDRNDLELDQDLLGHWFYHDALYSFVSQAFPIIEELNYHMEVIIEN